MEALIGIAIMVLVQMAYEFRRQIVKENQALADSTRRVREWNEANRN